MILSVTRASAKTLAKTGQTLPSNMGPKKSFGGVLADQSQKNTAIPTDPFKAMSHLSQTVMSQQKIPARDLLLYQIRAGEFGMHVELVSKVAESISASVQKLQNQG